MNCRLARGTRSTDGVYGNETPKQETPLRQDGGEGGKARQAQDSSAVDEKGGRAEGQRVWRGGTKTL